MARTKSSRGGRQSSIRRAGREGDCRATLAMIEAVEGWEMMKQKVELDGEGKRESPSLKDEAVAARAQGGRHSTAQHRPNTSAGLLGLPFLAKRLTSGCQH